jgi:hypothetical protein
MYSGLRWRSVVVHTKLRWGLAFAVATMFCILQWLHWLPGWSPDSLRIWWQSDSIMAGKGIANGFGNGRLDSHLPPGYAVFVAAVRCLADSQAAVRLVQLVLAFLSTLFVWRWTTGERLWVRVFLTAVPAFSIQARSLTGCVLSETFGLFLSTVCICLVASILKPSSKHWQSFITGIVFLACCLTSPAAAFVLAPFTLWFTCHSFRKGLCLCLGCLVLWIPWQIHCVRASGQIAPLLLTTESGAMSTWGATAWAGTWLSHERDMPFIWSGGDPSKAPEFAFRSDQERAAVFKSWSDNGARSAYPGPHSDLLHELARQRIRESLWEFSVRPSLRRAMSLCFALPDELMPYQQTYVFRLGPGVFRSDWAEVGLLRAIFRLVKSIYSSAWSVFHFLLSLLVVLAVTLALRNYRSCSFPMAVGLILFMLYFSVSPMAELRRNVPLLPFVLLPLRQLAKEIGSGAQMLGGVR